MSGRAAPMPPLPRPAEFPTWGGVLGWGLPRLAQVRASPGQGRPASSGTPRARQVEVRRVI